MQFSSARGFYEYCIKIQAAQLTQTTCILSHFTENTTSRSISRWMIYLFEQIRADRKIIARRLHQHATGNADADFAVFAVNMDGDRLAGTGRGDRKFAFAVWENTSVETVAPS